MSRLSRGSSPQLIQGALLPRCSKIFPARLVVNQIDDDVPHDRTPLFDPWVLISAIRFPVPSRDHENGFASRRNGFVALAMMKQLHEFAISSRVGLDCVWCKAQRRQAEYDRLAALCTNAGRSNPQQGFVCRGRAKVRSRAAAQGLLRAFEQSRQVSHRNSRLWVPPIVVMIKEPGSLLDTHLTAEGVFEPVLVAEVR